MENLNQLTDDELVKLYTNGKNEAFDILLERYKSKLYSYIYYTVHDEDVADDLFQETFVKVIVYLQANRYIPSGKFQAWIRRIAHNMIMDYYRQKVGENIVHNNAEDGELLNNSNLADPSIEMQQVNNQTFSDVEKLYKMLPNVQSQVVFMRFYQDLSFKEIADELGISINTALGRMRYALINMRRIAEEKNISLAIN